MPLIVFLAGYSHGVVLDLWETFAFSLWGREIWQGAVRSDFGHARGGSSGNGVVNRGWSSGICGADSDSLHAWCWKLKTLFKSMTGSGSVKKWPNSISGVCENMLQERDPYLDFLRAMAIILVLVYHVTQMWPIPQPWLVPYTHYGALGVDLFFVLSGWLIGGLYWREKYLTGSINLFLFWSRRWFRTIPPYLIGLLISWAAVVFSRSEPFDLGYLFFFQNYYERIPFFLVSWSLCVEEHFYFFVPILLLVCRDKKYYWLC